MDKIIKFITGLKQSTRMKFVSLGGIIAMTAFMLGIFIMFPITPAQKAVSSIGQEIVYREENVNIAPVTVVPEIITTDSAEVTTALTATTTAAEEDDDETTTSARTTAAAPVVTVTGTVFGWGIPTDNAGIDTFTQAVPDYDDYSGEDDYYYDDYSDPYYYDPSWNAGYDDYSDSYSDYSYDSGYDSGYYDPSWDYGYAPSWDYGDW